MKSILFVLLSIFITFVYADGTAYEITHYGGEGDESAKKNPSCLDQSHPSDEYYAAVSTQYGKRLCEMYAVVMGIDVDRTDSSYYGKMVKVQIIDSCSECATSHLDIGPSAFEKISKLTTGKFKGIWLAASTSGEIEKYSYSGSAAAEFAKKVYGLSESSFLDLYKAQALKMIKNGQRTGKFDKNGASVRTTTRKTTTTTKKTTTVIVPASKSVSNTGATGIGNILISSNTTNTMSNMTMPNPMVNANNTIANNNVKKPANPLVPVSTEDVEKEAQKEEEQKEEEGSDGSYTVGILSAALTVSGAAGVGLLYLKKKSPGKYDELKQKFPEAFENVKRSVSRSATTIKRGLTRTVTKGGRIGKKATSPALSRHGNHESQNYREMPDHMYNSEDGLPRITLYDAPSDEFPDKL